MQSVSESKISISSKQNNFFFLPKMLKYASASLSIKLRYFQMNVNNIISKIKTLNIHFCLINNSKVFFSVYLYSSLHNQYTHSTHFPITPTFNPFVPQSASDVTPSGLESSEQIFRWCILTRPQFPYGKSTSDSRNPPGEHFFLVLFSVCLFVYFIYLEGGGGQVKEN